jgi:hypothetical protein
MQRGLAVFSRPSLHAKFVIAGRTLIASSANVSRNSNESLDEAGIITSDPAAVQRAVDFFEKLCTEPVGKKYLAKCIKEYRPPKFKAAAEKPARTQGSFAPSPRGKALVHRRLGLGGRNPVDAATRKSGSEKAKKSREE